MPRPFMTATLQVAPERAGQERDVLVEELLLEVLGAGGDDHAPAQLDRGQEVGEGLARCRCPPPRAASRPSVRTFATARASRACAGRSS